MTPEEARLHIAYSGWASRKLLNAALALSQEQQQRDFGISFKSLTGTLEHIYQADRIWFARTVDSSILEKQDSFEVAWPRVQKRWEDWAALISDRELQRIVDFKDMKGNAHSNPVWQILLHVVNHATLHRGQAMGLLRQMGIAPPETDLDLFYWEVKAK